MALFDGESSYGTSSYGYEFQGRGNLLSDYEISHPHSFGKLSVFKEICNAFYTYLMDRDTLGKFEYLGFTHVKMEDIDKIDKIRKKIPKMNILYDSGEEVLVVKFMMGVTHEACASFLRDAFRDVVIARTGDRYSVLGVKSARFQGGRRMKEADDSFKPNSRHLETDWPSIAFEVGVSERLTQLQFDARFWLEYSGGQTRIVILASVDEIARKIIIERWQNAPRRQPSRNLTEPNPYSRNCIPILVQTLTLTEGQVYGGPALTIPADLVFDVLPPVPGAALGPRDFEVSADMLNSTNVAFWNALS